MKDKTNLLITLIVISSLINLIALGVFLKPINQQLQSKEAVDYLNDDLTLQETLNGLKMGLLPYMKFNNGVETQKIQVVPSIINLLVKIEGYLRAMNESLNITNNTQSNNWVEVDESKLSE